MRARVLLVSLLAISIGSGIACGGDEEAAPEGSPEGSPLVREAVREWAGVRLTLSVDREVYKVGQKVKVRAEAENIRSEQLLFRPVSPELPPLRLATETEITGTEEFSGGRTEGGEEGGLAPGGKLVREFEWDQQLAAYQTPVQAPAGTYEISAQVIVSPDETSRPDAVAIVVRFRLEGGEPVVAAEVAIETALFHDEVKQWFEGRPNAAVCADGNRDRFFLVSAETPSATETFVEAYQTQVQRGHPICSPVTEGDAWRVIFSSQAGPPPGRISAFIDLHDGAFLGVEEGGPGGTP
ncbi:MAG: hypothetical protein ACRDHY_10190 [Anaerolineales bacterium]